MSRLESVSMRPGELGRGRRIVLATFGSLGDLHPFIAVARGLKERGQHPVIATSTLHRERVERQGIEFAAVRPSFEGVEDDSALFHEVMHQNRGPRTVVALFMASLRESYDDLLEATRDADLLVSHVVAFAGPLVAEATGVPWVSAVLSPMSFFSAHDGPLPPQAPWMRHLRPLGPLAFGPFRWAARRIAGRWTEPVHRLRRELGLRPGGEPLFEGAHSSSCVLALFSKALGAPQPDWPRATVQTGFAFFDDVDATGMSTELCRFLEAGTPPLVFTLGSSAVMDAGSFYEESLAAAALLGRRAVLLIGTDPRNRPAQPLPETAIAEAYAPHSALFPRGAAIVHQGGVGTTGQALRSGRPMLVVPWAHDQPDNADRVRRLGVARTLARQRYSARSAARELARLLGEPGFTLRAEAVGREVRAEDGVAEACQAIERVLRVSRGA